MYNLHFSMVLSCSVVFLVSSLALCPALQALYGILLEQDFISRWPPCVAIVSRAQYHTWRWSLLGSGPVDRRALSCAIHTMTGPIFVVDESYSLLFWLSVPLS